MAAMSEDLSLKGDPEGDPVAYLNELVRGEISVNPDKLASAYLKLAEQSEGLQQLAYCALGWAVSNRFGENQAARKIHALEQRIAVLEKKLGK